MDTHQDVRNGALTEARLKKYIEVDRAVLEQQDPAEGLRPMGAATVAGYADEVLLLLKSSAKADAPSKDGESPLLLTALKANKNRARIIQLLLAKTSSSATNATIPLVGNNTPVMYVVQKGIESIRLLRKAGASLTLTNDDGYNAEDLAEKTYDKVVKRALNPEREKGDFKKLVDMVVALLLFIVAWEVNGGEDPTTAGFVEKVSGLVKDSPPERFFEGKEDFIQEVAKNAVELENDTSTSLGSPDLMPETIKVSLHQQVIYCDDGSSMKREDRWESQKNLVSEGVALRFINQEVPESSNLRLGDIENTLKPMKWDPKDNTEIGANLRSKILKPLVYDKVDSVPKSLERPLLVSILTDGGPDPEPGAMLKNAIVECSQELNAAKYLQESVKFMIGQIGTSKFATKFLKTIRDNTEIADMVHCTSGQLDERFKTEHEKEAKLDRWLIETLFEPLKDRKKKLEE
ncbi:hypothetical protein AOQ84DRAFT_400664 [Glonium stellatum]|uniref:Ankyrin repeat protein n=1 Tax=Glonium stellatum TaxID=574774 RepID=A0A8E2ER97_9PEZI|nr:hypothetical protein AOQ84DRAFT_400664 [Glonium stellatum]